MKTTLKTRFAIRFRLITQVLSLYKDKLDPGDVYHTSTGNIVVLDQRRRGFYTIYKVTNIHLTGNAALDSLKMHTLRLLYKLGLFI